MDNLVDIDALLGDLELQSDEPPSRSTITNGHSAATHSEGTANGLHNSSNYGTGIPLVR